MRYHVSFLTLFLTPSLTPNFLANFSTQKFSASKDLSRHWHQLIPIPSPVISNATSTFGLGSVMKSDTPLLSQAEGGCITRVFAPKARAKADR